jgi:hypothetical protein
VKLKLQAVVEELRRWTNQDFFNIFLDEAQAGMPIMDGYFPSRDGTGGRPLLIGWVWSLHKSVFAHFHFNLTGVHVLEGPFSPHGRLTLLTSV